ncbi:MAG: hypothetical protein ACREN2_01370 [Candidatus Dormibacteria bacterium]
MKPLRASALIALFIAACGGTSLPTRIPPVGAPQATISPGMPSGVPTALPDGRGGPSPVFWLDLSTYSQGDAYLLDFAPPDPSFDLHDPYFCGPAARLPCRGGGRFGKGPFYGMQLVGTDGHYRYLRQTPGGRTTVIAEGDVDVTHWTSVIATYPPG